MGLSRSVQGLKKNYLSIYLTPWIKDLLEKQVPASLVTKCPKLYGTLRLKTEFIRAQPSPMALQLILKQ
jgi:hypothetical protein